MSPEAAGVRVLVTGVGAIIGQGVVKSLRLLPEVSIIGLDRDPQAFGRLACDGFYVKPPVAEADPAYDSFLLELIEREAIDLVLPAIEQDVFHFDARRQLFASAGVAVALNDSRLIDLARDKWSLHQALLEAGLPAIATSLCGDWTQAIAQLGPAPLLCKPRRGSGGRGQALVADEDDLRYQFRKLGDNFMLQRLVGSADQEYTVGLFGYGDGTSSRPAILQRTLGPGGATWRARSVASDALIESACEALTAHFRPIGPTNYQFRKANGRAWLLEINPRLSASVSLRAALGFNEAAMSIDYFCRARRPALTQWRAASCTRYIEDHIEYL
ncbi:ATP-grasp domain-containing protein [Ectopseudomonas toyotomiensis]|uniref:ATP-grasp domain-containing protein n=1 Tax=Ectopseudomonas toyotomiensis TaxID=554344 RepID=A0ABD7DWW2_9GAMM|nr:MULTISPECIES: ATP-grasp domain-containing protein [Pseudomonas]QSL92998.1 ATP-grasp domain-containing protein [Pseudomonas toyotomiensis]SDA67470.1 carbamoyl-phosphate synthase large subunit [Pseudomonas sp. NFPP33]